MRFSILALIVIVALVVPSLRAETCYQDPDRCPATKCCKHFGASELVPFGTCKNLKEEGAQCELTPLTNSKAKHVYHNMCPCAAGLECVKNTESILTGICSKSSK